MTRYRTKSPSRSSCMNQYRTSRYDFLVKTRERGRDDLVVQIQGVTKTAANFRSQASTYYPSIFFDLLQLFSPIARNCAQAMVVKRRKSWEKGAGRGLMAFRPSPGSRQLSHPSHRPTRRDTPRIAHVCLKATLQVKYND